jgi:hypothetical protein
MAAAEKTTSAFSRSLDDIDRADWVDEEIRSLKQAVERDASGPAYDGHDESVLRPVIRPLVRRTGDPVERGDLVAGGVLQPPTALSLVLGQARRFVRRRRFDIVFYGLCIAFTIAVVLLAVSSGAR